jgi:hypothetical protein
VAVDSGNSKEEPLTPETEEKFTSFVSTLLKYSNNADQEEARQGKVALEAAFGLLPHSLQVAHAQAAFTLKVQPSSSSSSSSSSTPFPSSVYNL